MESITLKEIAGHLPYVEILITNYKCDYVGIEKAKVNGYYFINNDIYLTYIGGSTGKKLGTDCKLILNNLSMLTKDIEHNGEKVIPIVEIGKLLGFGNLEPFELDSGEIEYGWEVRGMDDFQPYSFGYFEDGNFGVWADEIDDSHPMYTHTSISAINLLYELHFDLHGLIERGLAIDKSKI